MYARTFFPCLQVTSIMDNQWAASLVTADGDINCLESEKISCVSIQSSITFRYNKYHDQYYELLDVTK